MINGENLVGQLDNTESIEGSINNNEAELVGNMAIGTFTEKDYEKLSNKPKINNVELIGNKNLEDLDIQEKMDYLTNMEIEQLIGE